MVYSAVEFLPAKKSAAKPTTDRKRHFEAVPAALHAE